MSFPTRRFNPAAGRNAAFDAYVVAVRGIVATVQPHAFVSLTSLHRPYDYGVSAYDAAQGWLFDHGYGPAN